MFISFINVVTEVKKQRTKEDKPAGSRRTVKHFPDKLSPVPTRTWSGLEERQR